MSPKSLNSGLRVTLVIVVAQAAVTIVAGLLAYYFFTPQHAMSAVLGGMICLITNALFGLRMFLGSRAPSAEQVISRLYGGVAQKFVLTIILFTVAIVWLDVQFAALILVYAAALMAFWLAILLNR